MGWGEHANATPEKSKQPGMAGGQVIEPSCVEGLVGGSVLLVSDSFGSQVGIGCSREKNAAVDQRNISRPFVVVTVCRVAFYCGCEPKNANTTPAIATAMAVGRFRGLRL